MPESSLAKMVERTTPGIGRTLPWESVKKVVVKVDAS
jgi:hypothetical protein